MLDSLWGRLLDTIAQKLAPAVIDQWVRPCRLLAVEGDHLKIGTPNTFSRDWLIQHHFQALQQAAQSVLGGQPRITIVVEESLEQAPAADAPPPLAARPGGGSTDGLNPRYTFDTFVVGSSNQFAQAACQAVAELPSKAYNPLFIYGGVGLGKTHLLHAVGYQSARLFPGMVAASQPPDFGTRVAILMKKAALERVRLGDDVAYLIASRVKSNIRELEGSLTRMIAFCALTGREMSVDLAQEVLGELWGEEEKIITIEQIQRKVGEAYGVKLSDLKAKNRTKAVAFPRQIAMYLARQLTHASLSEVGRAFGGKDHTTVLHAVDKIQVLLQEDPKLRKAIDGLIQGITL